MPAREAERVMPANRNINFGDSITGILIDGAKETPYVVATLHVDESTGVQVEVPYMSTFKTSQFDSVTRWFETEKPPENLLLTSLDGDISLFDCHCSGNTSHYPRGVGLGRIRPSNIVLQRRDGSLEGPLKVQEVRSHIDGLIEWTQFGAIKQTGRTDAEGRVQKVTIEAASLSEVSWRQGNALMRIGSDWELNPDRNKITVNESVSLTSTFQNPQPIKVHLAEHRKVASLLSFIFGTSIHFRRHDIRDPLFNGKSLDGKVRENLFYRMIDRSTVSEHAKPTPLRKRMIRPLVSFSILDSSGLEEWAQKYDTWGRFIHPAVSALNRPGSILENLVVNASMSMEAAGSLIGRQQGESATLNRGNRATTTTYMYRCLVKSGWDWSRISESRITLARAMANSYNTIKHFDRGNFPDPTETYLISSLTALVVRMIAIRISRPDLDPEALFSAQLYDFNRLVEEFKASGLSIDENGNFMEISEI
ncbi:ApeA N-terminal domain 1-containing protein [Streptomyces koyangensis]